jgi:hypothetical protein
MERVDFRDVEPGDVVVRLMAETVSMKLRVTRVDDQLIHCDNQPLDPKTEEMARMFPPDSPVPGGGWTFDRVHGVEEDLELGWGLQFGYTGSRLTEVIKNGTGVNN